MISIIIISFVIIIICVVINISCPIMIVLRRGGNQFNPLTPRCCPVCDVLSSRVTVCGTFILKGYETNGVPNIIMHYSMLHYTMLHYSMLHYTMLHYTMLH